MDSYQNPTCSSRPRFKQPNCPKTPSGFHCLHSHRQGNAFSLIHIAANVLRASSPRGPRYHPALHSLGLFPSLASSSRGLSTRDWEPGKWEAQGAEAGSSIIFLRVNVWLTHTGSSHGAAEKQSRTLTSNSAWIANDVSHICDPLVPCSQTTSCYSNPIH